MPTATYAVTGMHCPACEAKVRQALADLPGVRSVSAHAASGTLTVESDAPPDRAALAAGVARAGEYTLGGLVAAPVTERGTVRGSADGGAATPGAGPKGAKGYRALAVLIGYILVVSVLAELPRPTLDTVMANFMGGFFLAFSFFKFLDLRGFAAGFARYDILASAWSPWRYIYPFVELALGLAYLTRFLPVPTHVVTLVVMVIGAAGVIRSLMRRDQIKCACLGSVIDLPLGTVTLIEDLGMAFMAAAMLTLHFTH